MITRIGRVDAVDDPLVSPLRGEPCVLYVVEVTDVVTKQVLAGERHGVAFTIASSDGKHTALVPTHAVFEGFAALDRSCRADQAGARVSAFLEDKGLRVAPERHLRIVERRIAIGDLVSATGALRPPLPPTSEPYRTPLSSGVDALEPAGLILVDVRHRRSARLQWLAVGALGALVAAIAIHHVSPNEYRSQEDCPPGTTFQPDHSPDDFCGNPAMARRWLRQSHGADATSAGGVCVGNGKTYYAPSDQAHYVFPWSHDYWK